MWCVKCNNHVGDCTCPDIAERLASIGGAGNTAAKFCRKCNLHYALCHCPEPDFFIRIGGEEKPMSALGTELKTLEQFLKHG